MAMTTCKECNGNISSKAEVCPHCGFRHRNEVVRALFSIAFGIVILYFVSTLIGHR
jgi:hypothetical protein